MSRLGCRVRQPLDTRHPSPDTVRRKLLVWFRREKRSLPWRSTRDPYRIWVSEVMLQQTTVAAVRRRYAAFLSRFPDLTSLARTSEESVLAAWSGLGYYARARNLQRAAREIVDRHGGRLPRDPAALRALPGFGDYMAAAVASLAFGQREPALDANVTRALSRLFAIAGIAGTRAHGEAVGRRAAALLPTRRPGDVTAALMDLGQLICTPRRPRCGVCPLSGACAAYRRGDVARFPRRRARPATLRVHVAAACATRAGRVLVLQRPEALLRGLWQFPCAEGTSPAAALRSLRSEIAQLGLRLDGEPSPVVTRHTIVNRRLEIAVYRAKHASNPKSEIRNPKLVRWLTPKLLAKTAIPTLTRKIATAAGFLPAPAQRILSTDARLSSASPARRRR